MGPPYTENFYDSINCYLDDMGLDKVDPEEYYENLFVLNRLKVAKYLSN